jgi:hypothetical protein
VSVVVVGIVGRDGSGLLRRRRLEPDETKKQEKKYKKDGSVPLGVGLQDDY